jgi:uncharacterized repeat protein (TIGR03803 family)
MIRLFRKYLGVACAAAAAACAVCGAGGQAMAANALYSFPNPQDSPYLSVVDSTPAAAGSLYGVAPQSNYSERGYVFGLMKSSGTYTFQTLYTFCNQDSCSDGRYPVGRLVMDTSGNLYGVTAAGGLSNTQSDGTVFELMPNADRSAWTLVTLYKFCQLANCADGMSPSGGLTYAGATAGALYDGTSPLYGAAGTADGHGMVFVLKRARNGVWKEKILHEFCRKDGCTDGAQPTLVVADPSGNLVGIASGGISFNGVVFRLDASQHYRSKVLHRFCSKQNCYDGGYPMDIGMDSGGHIYGVTLQGGRKDDGVLFGIGGGGYEILHQFCKSQSTDGCIPLTLLVTAGGSLFGTTAFDNVHGGGEIFAYDASGYHQISYLCAQQNCSDGAYPWGLAYDGGSALYGTTSSGGSADNGVIYEQDLP